MKSLGRIMLTILLCTAGVLAFVFLAGKLEAPAEKESLAVSAPEETAAVQTEPVLQTQPAETAPLETVPPVTEMQMAESSVPRYYQTDYPYIKFGNGTMATSGCSVTCLAMVATYLTEQEYTPDQLAYHFGSYGKNNIERLEYGNAQMQLPVTRTENILDVLQALRSGKVAVAMMDDESLFTSTQHFIVLAGVNEKGKFIVHDPMEPNITNADAYARGGYENGFGEHDLMRGFSGAWIYDKAAMPEEPFLFDVQKLEQEKNRYDGYILTDEDNHTLACFVWAEGRDKSQLLQQAMVEVVLNRVVSPDYPNTVRDVIYHTEFYRAVPAMEGMLEGPDFPQYIAVTSAMYGPYVLPKDVCFYSEWEVGKEVWGELEGYTFAKAR